MQDESSDTEKRLPRMHEVLMINPPPIVRDSRVLGASHARQGGLRSVQYQAREAFEAFLAFFERHLRLAPQENTYP